MVAARRLPRHLPGAKYEGCCSHLFSSCHLPGPGYRHSLPLSVVVGSGHDINDAASAGLKVPSRLIPPPHHRIGRWQRIGVFFLLGSVAFVHRARWAVSELDGGYKQQVAVPPLLRWRSHMTVDVLQVCRLVGSGVGLELQPCEAVV
jgi:hypothetical protein